MHLPKIDPEARDWSPFLHRISSLEAVLRGKQLAAALAGRRILITGAGGCLGSALAHAIAPSLARELLLLDTSEGALYSIHQSLSEEPGTLPPIPILASVCDAAAISSVFRQHRPADRLPRRRLQTRALDGEPIPSPPSPTTHSAPTPWPRQQHNTAASRC